MFVSDLSITLFLFPFPFPPHPTLSFVLTLSLPPSHTHAHTHIHSHTHTCSTIQERSLRVERILPAAIAASLKMLKTPQSFRVSGKTSTQTTTINCPDMPSYTHPASHFLIIAQLHSGHIKNIQY